MAGDHTPLLWRLRGRLQSVFALLAVGIVLLGLFVTGAAVVAGPLEQLAVGIPLVVGGLFVMVMGRGRRG